MDTVFTRTRGGSRAHRSGAKAWSGRSVETLEERQLLSSGMGMLGGFGAGEGRAAEMSSFRMGRQGGFFGGGTLGLGGGMSDPTLLLTAPLLEGGSGQSAPPSPAVFSNSAVQSAMQTLQTDMKTDIPSGAKPTHASVGALEDTLDAIRKGTLSGTAATTQIQTDQAAILTSMGLTAAQVSQLQSDQQALQTAISNASTSTTTTTSTGSTTTTSTSTGPSSAVQTSAVQAAMQTLQTAFQADMPSSPTISHEAVGQVEDDLDAIRKGTLTGSAAVTQVETDAAAALTSEGFTSTQVSQIQADQQALATAIAASPMPTTTTGGTSSATMSTLQSVSAYLVGLPGISSFGAGGGVAIRGFGSRGMGGGGFGQGGGFGGPGGGPMMWR
jgi:hypothetical protein